MGKFLRVLAVINLIFAACVLTLSILLFNKRDILIGRNTTLEAYAIKIGHVIEAKDAEPPEVAPERVEQDLGGTMDPTAEPEPDTFWSTYRTELEQMVDKTMKLEGDLRSLRSYFLRTELDNSIQTDPVSGAKITTGERTVDGVMKQLLERATKQYQVLTETRSQLTATRKYLEEVIANHNKLKELARQRQGVINDLNDQIAQLNATIAELRNEISMLNDKIVTLEGQIADLEAAKRIVEEERDALQVAKEQLVKENKELRAEIDVLTNPDTGGPRVPGAESTGVNGIIKTVIPMLEQPGVKGHVVAVNQPLGFVVLKLDPDFTEKLMNYIETFKGNMLPQIEVELQRNGQFVTKARLRDLDRSTKDMLYVADIMSNWQQLPVKEGDSVVYKK